MQGYEGAAATGPQLLASVVPLPNAASPMANMGLPPTAGGAHADATHAAYAHQLPHASGGVELLLAPFPLFTSYLFLAYTCSGWSCACCANLSGFLIWSTLNTIPVVCCICLASPHLSSVVLSETDGISITQCNALTLKMDSSTYKPISSA